jgi:hypothetical protein
LAPGSVGRRWRCHFISFNTSPQSYSVNAVIGQESFLRGVFASPPTRRVLALATCGLALLPRTGGLWSLAGGRASHRRLQRPDWRALFVLEVSVCTFIATTWEPARWCRGWWSADATARHWSLACATHRRPMESCLSWRAAGRFHDRRSLSLPGFFVGDARYGDRSDCQVNAR